MQCFFLTIFHKLLSNKVKIFLVQINLLVYFYFTQVNPLIDFTPSNVCENCLAKLDVTK